MGRSRGMGQRDDAPPHGVGGYPHGVDVDFPDARFAGVLGSRGQDASPVNCSRGRPDLPDETGNDIPYIVDVFLPEDGIDADPDRRLNYRIVVRRLAPTAEKT